MYCVPIKTGIKTNPHLFPVHQRRKKKGEEKKVERTTARHTCMLSPHHFPLQPGRRAWPGSPDLFCWDLLYIPSHLGLAPNPEMPPSKANPELFFCLFVWTVEQPCWSSCRFHMGNWSGICRDLWFWFLVLVSGFKAGTSAMGYTDPSTRNPSTMQVAWDRRIAMVPPPARDATGHRAPSKPTLPVLAKVPETFMWKPRKKKMAPSRLVQNVYR